MTFTAKNLRDLAQHIEDGKAICTHDLGGSVHLLLRTAALAMDELAEMKALANHEEIVLSTTGE